MSLFERLKKQQDGMEAFNMNIPDNAKVFMMPSDGVPFSAQCDVAKILTYERFNEEKNTKETFMVDQSVAEELPRTEIALKVMHVMQTQDGEVRLALLSRKPTNSWNRSKLEALQNSAEGKVISVTRDKEAKVYGHTVEYDLEPIVIDMKKVEAQFEAAFADGFVIDSLDHPVAQQLIGKQGEFVDGVDDEKDSVADDTLAKANTDKAEYPLNDDAEAKTAVNSDLISPDELDEDFYKLDNHDDMEELNIDEVDIDYGELAA
ncbi:hypothetical protein ACPV40_19045 [Vibrio alfacsensis]|uniref:hypothetical protein n=1 Tax=Vibrio alfacsensis TaxID=1074311 RepID=UPI0040698B39